MGDTAEKDSSDDRDPDDDLACTEEVELMTDYLEGALPRGRARGGWSATSRPARAAPSTSSRCGRSPARSAASRGDTIPPEMRGALIAAFRDFRNA